MTSPQPKTDCQNLQQFYRHLLELKKDFDSLMDEINSLRLNIHTNITEIKQKITSAQCIRKNITLTKKDIKLLYKFLHLPEDKFSKNEILMGGQTKEEIKQLIKLKGMKISEIANNLLDSEQFTISSHPKKEIIIKTSVKNLGLSGFPTWNEIIDKAKSIGLELCPREFAPYLRLYYDQQDKWKNYIIAIEPFSDKLNHELEYAFRLDSDNDGLWLKSEMVAPFNKYREEQELVFWIKQ